MNSIFSFPRIRWLPELLTAGHYAFCISPSVHAQMRVCEGFEGYGAGVQLESGAFSVATTSGEGRRFFRIKARP